MSLPPDHISEETGFSGPRALAGAFRGLLRAHAGMLIALVVLAVGLELGLRALRPELADQVYGPVLTGGHPIAFSDRSFRVPAGAPVQAAPAILALGDSTTFGTSVGAEETWPLRLGAALDLPVANAGFPGGGLGQLAHGLDTLWADPVPPVVLLLVTGNMVSFTEHAGDTPPRDPLARVRAARRHAGQEPGLKTRARNALQGSALRKIAVNLSENLKYALGLSSHRTDPAAPLGPLMAYGWQQPDLSPDYAPRMWAAFEAELAALDAQVRDMGSCMVMGFLPPRFELSDRLGDNLKFVPKSRLSLDAGARVGEIAAGMGLPFIDMTGVLRQVRADHAPWEMPLYAPNDYTHLSAEGHGVVATAFAEALTPCADRLPR